MSKTARPPLLSLPKSRRRFLAGASAGLAGIIASGRAPAFAQGTAPTKLVCAHIVPPPESAAVGFSWMAEEITKRSKGALEATFYGGTLLSKELEIMNAVKAGNVAIPRLAQGHTAELAFPHQRGAGGAGANVGGGGDPGRLLHGSLHRD